MSVEFRNSSCVVSWFSNTDCTFWLKKRHTRESTTTDTSVDSHWENVTSDDHMSSQSTPQFHLEWLWQLSRSDDQIMELCLRAIRLQRLCGVVVRSQLYRSLLFMLFFWKANLNQLDVGNMSPLQRPRPHRTQPHHSCSRICSDLFWQFSSGQTYVVESVRCHEHKRRKVIGNLLGFYHVHGYWMNISCHWITIRISQGLWSAANSDCNG